MEENKGFKPRQSSLISEAAALAIIPVVAYAFLYSFESGLLAYFGIPSQYINLSLSELFLAISGLVLILSPIYPFINIVYMVSGNFSRKDSQLKFLLIMFLAIYLFAMALLFYFSDKPYISLILLIIGFIFTAYFFFPLLQKKYKGPLSERFEQRLWDIRDRTNVETLETTAIKIAGLPTVVITILFLPILYILHLSGGVVAYNKQVFNIIKTTPECAIIYTRDDYLLCTIFDKTKREFEPGYQIYRNEDIKGVRIVREVIGPLHLKPTATPTPKPTFTPTITRTPSPTPFLTETLIPYP